MGRPVNINIGMIIFMVILIYVVYSIFRYATARHIVGYEVRKGSLTANRVYEGLALRQEEVALSEYPGHINYYTKEGDRLATGKLAYTIDESGQVAQALSSADADDTIFSASDYSAIRNEIISFDEHFSGESFGSLYAFKDKLSGTVQRITNNSVLEDIADIALSGSIHYGYTENTGYMVYYTDGYEDKTFDDLVRSDFDSASYTRNNLDNNALISAGDPAYKMETAEDWGLAILLQDPEEAAALEKIGVIKVRFLKNQYESWANVSTRQDENGQCYALLSFTNSMSTFCTERFIDVELILSGTTGLKIPRSALIDDTFYVVPSDLVTHATGGQDLVYRKTIDEQGMETTEPVSVDLYGQAADGSYYLDQTRLRKGDVLIKQGKQRTFTVGKTAELKGVYNINKGYADFRQVIVMEENDEYAIVKPDSVYGLREYDYIVLDASAMTPDEFIYQ